MAVKIALAGNPNCGKTTLFNALTGSNQFVGNWPGAVSYTHLDVYKRQNQESPSMEREKYEYVNEGIRAASAYIEKHIYENGDFRGSGNVALVGPVSYTHLTEILLHSRGVAASGFPPLCNIPHCLSLIHI